MACSGTALAFFKKQGGCTDTRKVYRDYTHTKHFYKNIASVSRANGIRKSGSPKMFIDVLLDTAEKEGACFKPLLYKWLKIRGEKTKHLALKLGGKDQTSCQTIWKKKLHAN
jgi:hypothetical protein